MARKYICDIPGCSCPRQRWQRLCASCFERLSHYRRTAIKRTFKLDKKRHRQECRDAAAELGIATARAGVSAPPLTTPERAFELQQRLLGERSDA